MGLAVFLAVIALVASLACANAEIQPDTYYSVPPSACTLPPGAGWAVDSYGPWRGPLVPPTIADGVISTFYPAPDTTDYLTEGVRYSNSKCSFCPYSNGAYETVIEPEFLMNGGIRGITYAMYGPCFNGAPSARMSCVQNQVLYPSAFVGEYFYPTQERNPYAPFPAAFHGLIEGKTPTDVTNLNADGSPKLPTDYGLGRGRVRQNLGTFQIIQNSTRQVNTTLTAQIQAPYATSSTAVPNAKEGWAKWAQHFCSPACHRDALIQDYEIQPSDWANQPALSFLSRRVLSTKTPGATEPLTVVRCRQCPPFQAAYRWGYTNASNGVYVLESDMPADPRNILIQANCMPWFGSVPLLTPYVPPAQGGSLPTFLFANVTTVHHGPPFDSVRTPAAHNEYVGTPCPVDTYNDRCAHYHKLYAIETLPAPTAGMPPMPQPQCTPCPPGGFHTGGLRGAWFCLPPPGKTALIVLPPVTSALRGLLNLFVDGRNMSTLWARRDVLGIQWECGLTAAHCRQCADHAGMAGKRPHEFNLEMITQHLFVWQDCPHRYYCPTALGSDPIACPPDFPWSPRGSASRSNCTCARGRYLDAATRTCLPCRVPSAACGVGQYLAGTTLCTQTDGATSGGVCTPCTNAPPGATYVDGVGIEVLNSLTNQYHGACSFNCAPATALLGSGTCLSKYACAPLAPPRDLEQRQVYSGALAGLGDGFRVLPNCAMQRNLSALVDGAMAVRAEDSPLWLLTSATCAEASPGACQAADRICAVVTNATYAADHACAACPPAPPNGFYDSATMRGALAYACDVRCAAGHYFNSSARRCGACADLDALVCGGGTMHVRGAGCYGSAAPFVSMTNLALLRAAHCIQCDKAPTAAGGTQYLDTSAAAGCEYAACSASADVQNGLAYIVTDCGGTTNFITAPCTFECGAGFYLDGACTQRTTGVCRPCTASKPGYYRIGECGQRADSVWQQCGVPPQGGAFVPGYYCPGAADAGSVPCPNNKTSLPFAISDGAHCFCPAGTRPSLVNDDTCVPVRCADAVAVRAAPGGGFRSASYMTIDASAGAPVSVCRPCSPSGGSTPAAFTLGDGLQLGACQCPPGFYAGAHSSTNAAMIVCAACPEAPAASCAAGGRYYAAVPNECWSGRTQGYPGCQCLAPPFTSGIGIQCAPTPGMCARGFLLAPDFAAGGPFSGGGPVPRERATGSAVYISQAKALEGWAIVHETAPNTPNRDTYDFGLIDLATTSDYGEWGDDANLQYALWLIADERSTNVYAVPLGASYQLAFYDPYSSADVWNVVPVSYTSSYCTVERLAVAQWTTPQTPARLLGSGASYSLPTDAAVVVVDHTLFASGTSLFLYLNTLAVNVVARPLGTIAWGTPNAQRIAVTNKLNATAVAIAHAYTPPGGRGGGGVGGAAASTPLLSGSTFYVAYNVPALASVGRPVPTCEIAAIAVRSGDATQRIRLVLATADAAAPLQLHAMALLPAPSDDGVYLYLAFASSEEAADNNNNNAFAVRLLKWTTAIATAADDAAMMVATVLDNNAKPVDELFFLEAVAPQRVRRLSILWPSTALTPVFFALVEDARTDAASAQGILHRDAGHLPLRIHVADLVQRTFVPVQGMPHPTRPTHLAVAGTDLGRLRLLASNGSTVFALAAARCGNAAAAGGGGNGDNDDDAPRYWDGAQCLAHACVRARSCNTAQGQVWHAKQFRCVCVPGFFTASAANANDLVCQACAAEGSGSGYYCPGNGTRAACPVTLTSPPRATALSDCLCRPGEHFTTASGRCAPCPAGQWCPNQWDAVPCPGAADLARSTGGSSYPTTCVCNPGTTGVGCAPCPPGLYCASSTTATVVNNALRLRLFGSTTVLEEDRVCATLRAAMLDYFLQGSAALWYLRDAATVPYRVWCRLVPAPGGRTSVAPVAVVMVQTETGDFDNSIVTGLPAVLRRLSNATTMPGGGFVIEDVQPASTPLYLELPNNTALQCPVGKAPAPPALTTCICAPGYAPAQSSCRACAPGEYKAAAGAGTCTVCPIGTTSAAAASACVGGKPKNNTTAPTTDSGTGGGLNLPLIAGGVAGGVLVVGTLIYAFIMFAD